MSFVNLNVLDECFTLDGVLLNMQAPPQRPAENHSIFLGTRGPQLTLWKRVWTTASRLLPEVAVQTAALPADAPHALTKKCLLAALLKAVSVYGPPPQHHHVQHRQSAKEPGGKAEAMTEAGQGTGHEVPRAGGPTAVSGLWEAALQLSLQFEDLLLQHTLAHDQTDEVAVAAANCLAFFVGESVLLRESEGTTASQWREVLQLHCRNVQHFAEAAQNMDQDSYWPLLACAGSGLTSSSARQRLDESEEQRLQVRASIVGSLEKLRGSLSKMRAAATPMTAPRLQALVDCLCAAATHSHSAGPISSRS